MISRSIDGTLVAIERIRDHAPVAARCFALGAPERIALDALVAAAQHAREALETQEPRPDAAAAAR